MASSPNVQVLHDRFANDPSVTVLAVAVDGRGDPVEYVKKNDYTFTLVPDGGDLARKFGVTAIPTFVVVGPDGTVLHEHVGKLGDDDRDEIERISRAAAARAGTG